MFSNRARQEIAHSCRGFHTSAGRYSHVGSLPIPLPATVTLDLPIASISPTLPTSSPSSRRSVLVTGPLGTQTVDILPPVMLTPSSVTPPSLSVTVHDTTEKSQRSVWGLTRSLLHNAMVGVTVGYNVELRLVGVGYRGAVEPIPEVFLNLQRQLLNQSRSGGKPNIDHSLPSQRLNLKLGYAHPVLIDIPFGITVTTPSPTKMVLSGTDKQRLGLFAAKIRRWRKPEPYRGKGIFVGDETIKLKEIKKK